MDKRLIEIYYDGFINILMPSSDVYVATERWWLEIVSLKQYILLNFNSYLSLLLVIFPFFIALLLPFLIWFDYMRSRELKDQLYPSLLINSLVKISDLECWFVFNVQNFTNFFITTKSNEFYKIYFSSQRYKQLIHNYAVLMSVIISVYGFFYCFVFYDKYNQWHHYTSRTNYQLIFETVLKQHPWRFDLLGWIDSNQADLIYFSHYHIKSIDNFIPSFHLAVDGISIVFVLLTVILFPFYFLSLKQSIFKYRASFVILFFILESFLFLSFLTVDIFIFYLAFESLLIPMTVIIVVWGSRTRKIQAVYYFFFYTLFGSLCLLSGILIIYVSTGTTNIEMIYYLMRQLNSDLLVYPFDVITFCLLMTGFMIKLPIFPFHLWLPEAHVEAPTAGSMLLAGILLKLGGYGIIRFVLSFFPKIVITYYGVIFLALGVLGVIYSSFVALAQEDLKKIIAYSSISHMNLMLIGLMSGTIQGVSGAIVLLFGHGIISSGLFFLVGCLYDRTHTRNINYFGGLFRLMPIFSGFFLFFTLGNIAFPGTANFAGELLILWSSTSTTNNWVLLLVSPSLLTVAYSFVMFTKLCLGTTRITNIKNFFDLTKQEIFTLLIFSILIGGIGFFPTSITDFYDIVLKTLLYELPMR